MMAVSGSHEVKSEMVSKSTIWGRTKRSIKRTKHTGTARSYVERYIQLF